MNVIEKMFEIQNFVDPENFARLGNKKCKKNNKIKEIGAKI